MTDTQASLLTGLVEAETAATIRQYIDNLSLEDKAKLTVEMYKRCLEKYRQWLKGDPVTIYSAKKYLAGLRDRGLAQKTIIIYYHALRGYLAAQGLDLKIKFKKMRPLPPPYHGPEEVAAMLKALYDRRDNWSRLKARDLCIFYVYIYTGMRREEIHLLETGDIDFQERTIRIRKGKGGYPRMVPIAPPLYDVLKEYVTESKVTGRLFQVNAQRLSRIIKAVARAAGIEDFHGHSARHYFATQLNEAGVPLNVIKELLGHQDIATTAIYLDVRPTAMHQAVSKLSDIGQSCARLF